MIKQSTIDQVNDIPLLDIIKKYVDLKKIGATWRGKSPFKEENTPSFHVSVAKGLYKCFATGKGGNNGVSFVIEKEGLSYPEAIKAIAGDHGITFDYDNSDDGKARLEEYQNKMEISDVNALALEYFQSYIKEVNTKQRRATNEEVKEFGLGYANKDFQGLIEFLKSKGISTRQMQMAELITNKDGKTFDFFNNRVMFPVYNWQLQICGFSGRDLAPEPKAKYLNSRQTKLFDKSSLFLGMDVAKPHIVKHSSITLVEGNYDVLAMARIGMPALSPCGTSLTEAHAKELARRGVKDALIVFDGDVAGQKALIRTIPVLTKFNVIPFVYILPEGKDPDDVFKPKNDAEKKEIIEKVDQDKQDGIIYYAKQLYKDAKEVHQEVEANKQLTSFLVDITDVQLRDLYIKKIVAEIKNLKRGELEKDVKAKLKLIQAQNKQEEEQQKGPRLPKYLSELEREEYEKFGFYEDPTKEKKGYWFKQGSHSFEQVSNFLVKPLFHVESHSNNRRLVEIQNKHGQHIIEVPSKGFVNSALFQEECMNHGNFQFFGQPKQFKYISNKFLDMMPKCMEITTLGWQDEGFFAFADGIAIDGKFKKVDAYGIVEVDKVEEKTNHFLPAFSSIYKNFKGQEDPYESDRKFVFKKSPLSFSQWAEKYVRVNGVNGMFGVAWLIGTLFKDIVVSKTDMFPILFNFGDVETGKSAAARGLFSILLGSESPINLTTATAAAFGRKLAQFKNAPMWMDEYTNDIDEKTFQALKPIHDNSGRAKGRATMNNKTTTDKINASAIISGQFLPTRDNNSLYTRICLLTFSVKAAERTNEDMSAYEDLQEYQSKGLSSIVLEVLKYRDLVKDTFGDEYYSILKEIKTEFGNANETYIGRVTQNFTVLLVFIKLFAGELNLPFTYKEFKAQTKEHIIDQSKAISNSDVLKSFWDQMEYLFMNGTISYNKDFTIDQKATGIKLYKAKGEYENIHWDKPKKLLYIRLTQIHPEYMKSMRQQENRSGVNKTSLKEYMKAHKSYIGSIPTHTFGNQRTSAMVFDYDMLGVSLQVNSEQSKTEANQEQPQQPATAIDAKAAENKDDLPF